MFVVACSILYLNKKATDIPLSIKSHVDSQTRICKNARTCYLSSCHLVKWVCVKTAKKRMMQLEFSNLDSTSW